MAMGVIATRWASAFFRHALVTASMSKDPRGKVGAVIVDDRMRIISSGFNGLPSGIEHSRVITMGREDRLACTIHAEENALAFAWRDVKGMQMYCTRHPCARCAAMIVQRGIVCVHMLMSDDTINPDWAHSFDMAQDMMKQANVGVEYYSMTCSMDHALQTDIGFYQMSLSAWDEPEMPPLPPCKTPP